MITIKIEIPDEHESRVLEAFKAVHGDYDSEAAPSMPDYVADKLKGFVKAVVINHEAASHAAEAREKALAKAQDELDF